MRPPVKACFPALCLALLFTVPVIALAEHEGCDRKDHENGDITVTSGDWCSGLHRDGFDWGDTKGGRRTDAVITIKPGKRVRAWKGRNGSVIVKIVVSDGDGSNPQEADGSDKPDKDEPDIDFIVPDSGKVTFWTKKNITGGHGGIVDITPG